MNNIQSRIENGKRGKKYLRSIINLPWSIDWERMNRENVV